MQTELQNTNASLLERHYSTFNATLISMKRLTFSLSNRSSLQFIATRGDTSSDNALLYRRSISETIASVQTAYDYIDSIYVYLKKSDQVITRDGVTALADFSDTNWLEFYSAADENRTTVRTRAKRGNYPYLITMLHPISFYTDENLGAVILNIDAERLAQYFGTGRYRTKNDSSMMIIYNDTMDTMVYSDEYRLLHDEMEDAQVLQQFRDRPDSFSEIQTLWGKQYVISGKYADTEGLRFLYLSPMTVLETSSNESNWRLRMVSVVSFALCVVLAVLMAIWVYRPIQRTAQLLDRTQQLTAWDKKRRVDEIVEIQRGILLAQSENKHLNEEIEERMLSLHHAQICALQTQINPHFLYNTLDAIGNAAALQLGERNDVTDMIYTLGKLMRLSLSGENYLVPVREELEHVKLYVKIMDFRHKGNIHVHLDIPDEAMEERIVKLTLQPLIENAIEHGLSQRHCRGDIWLKCRREQDEIWIYVVDNGAGMTDDEIQQLKARIDTPIVQSTHHIGLRNVNQRMKLMYGNRYGLRIGHAQEGGLCVAVHFSAEIGEKDGHNVLIAPKDGTVVG